MRSHDPKFPSASGKPGPDYKGPRASKTFSLVFGQCLGKDRGQKGVPKWTNRWDFNRQNSGEMNHNWQSLTGSWIFWGACLPPLNPSVPSGIDSGTQLLRNVALPSSAHGPQGSLGAVSSPPRHLQPVPLQRERVLFGWFTTFSSSSPISLC